MSRHTPEPWAVGPLETSDGLRIWQTDEHGNVKGIVGFVLQRKPSRELDEITEANARRIVACVNACDGIDIEDLEAASVSIIHKLHDEAAKKVLSQRDELLDALRGMLEVFGDDESDTVDAARAAIAKATGGQE